MLPKNGPFNQSSSLSRVAEEGHGFGGSDLHFSWQEIYCNPWVFWILGEFAIMHLTGNEILHVNHNHEVWGFYQ